MDAIWEHKKGRVWLHVRRLEQENTRLRHERDVLLSWLTRRAIAKTRRGPQA